MKTTTFERGEDAVVIATISHTVGDIQSDGEVYVAGTQTIC